MDRLRNTEAAYCFSEVLRIAPKDERARRNLDTAINIAAEERYNRCKIHIFIRGMAMKVLAINGSGRKDGNTFLLLKTVLDELKNEGIETDIIQLAEGKPIQGCISCFKCMERKNMKCTIETDSFNEYFARIGEADGILLGSPVYFSDVTAGMRALIERCGLVSRANGGVLRRKGRRRRDCSAPCRLQFCPCQHQLPVPDQRDDHPRIQLLEHGDRADPG